MRSTSFPVAPIQMQMYYNEPYPTTTMIQNISTNICIDKKLCRGSERQMNMESDQYVQNVEQKNRGSLVSDKLNVDDYVQREQQMVNDKAPDSKPKKLAIVLFDWDDSMYPTSALLKARNNTKKQFNNVSLIKFKEFGEILYNTFQTYIKLFDSSNIYIVTNGSTEWVLKSLTDSSLYYKQAINTNKDYNEDKDKDHFIALYNLFLELDISIISAKRLYGFQFPKKPMLWKSKTFCQIADKSFDFSSISTINNIRNTYIIISIGDSDNEYIAAREARYLLQEQNRYYRQNNIIRLHRVKLKKKPSITDIIKQLRFLIIEASNMNQEQGSIDIQFR